MSGGARCTAGTPSSSSIGAPAHLRYNTSSCRAEQCPSRSVSHLSASSSSSTFCPSSNRSTNAAYTCACRALRRKTVIVRALFEPPPFQPSKLSISLAPGATSVSPAPPDNSRRYTLTHNDITGQLWLTVGQDFNDAQISGFYTRLLRDEVVAEWTSEGDSPSLHLYCHVSGEEKWLAPPILRNYIFRREMPLVLDCVLYAERELLQLNPRLAQAQVFVHFQSSVPELDCTERWGILGERNTWQAVPVSILKRILFGIMGRSLEASQPTASASAVQECMLEEESLPGLSLSPVVAAATIVEGALPAQELLPQQQQQPLGPEMGLETAACSCAAASACAHTPASTSPEQGGSMGHSHSRAVSNPAPEQPVARQTALLAECSASEALSGAREGPMPLDGSLLLIKSRQLSNLMTSCRK